MLSIVSKRTHCCVASAGRDIHRLFPQVKIMISVEITIKENFSVNGGAATLEFVTSPASITVGDPVTARLIFQRFVSLICRTDEYQLIIKLMRRYLRQARGEDARVYLESPVEVLIRGASSTKIFFVFDAENPRGRMTFGGCTVCGIAYQEEPLVSLQ